MANDRNNVRKSADGNQKVTELVVTKNIQPSKVKWTHVEPTAFEAIGHNIPVIKKCSVQIERLDYTLARELHNMDKGYNLRRRELKHVLDRRGNARVDYCEPSETCSSEEDTTTNKRRKISVTIKPTGPRSGPSAQRQAAQAMIDKKKQDAAKALLALSTGMAKLDPDTDSVVTSEVGSNHTVCTPEHLDSGDGTVIPSDDEDNKKLDNTPVQKKGKFVNTFYGIKRKYKRKRNFKCDDCDFRESNLKRLNDHYRSEHGELKCLNCDETFNTPSALRKHGYSHTEKAGKKPCEDCGKRFTFDSELKSHRLCHRKIGDEVCMTCGKRFKSIGELNKHIRSHSGKTWKCQKCKYTCTDRRNLAAHMHVHSDKNRYKCASCSKEFRHYMQLTRHKKLHKTELKRSNSPEY